MYGKSIHCMVHASPVTVHPSARGAICAHLCSPDLLNQHMPSPWTSRLSNRSLGGVGSVSGASVWNGNPVGWPCTRIRLESVAISLGHPNLTKPPCGGSRASWLLGGLASSPARAQLASVCTPSLHACDILRPLLLPLSLLLPLPLLPLPLSLLLLPLPLLPLPLPSRSASSSPTALPPFSTKGVPSAAPSAVGWTMCVA